MEVVAQALTLLAQFLQELLFDDGIELEVQKFSVAVVDQVHLAGGSVAQEGMEDEVGLAYFLGSFSIPSATLHSYRPCIGTKYSQVKRITTFGKRGACRKRKRRD